jgi:hypothetical protein
MLTKVLYWLAVLLVSFAVLVGLVLFLESRDDSSLGETGIRFAPVGAVR